MKIIPSIKYIGLGLCLVVLVPLLGFNFITGTMCGYFLLGGLLVCSIGFYIEEYRTETLSSIQQNKRKKNLDSLRNAILGLAIIIILYIAFTSKILHFL